MINPEKVLPEYFDRLTNRVLNLRGLRKQLKQVTDWETPGSRRQALDLGAYFYKWTMYCFSRTILVELAALVSCREERSLLDWLQKAREAAPSLNPTKDSDDVENPGRISIPANEYRAIIDDQLDELAGHASVIENIKSRRDKAIAHFDKKYFDDPNAQYDDFPLADDDVDDLIETLSSIVQKQHSLLNGSHLFMDVVAHGQANTVLAYSRAFQRVRSDQELTVSKGVSVTKYLED